MHRHTNAQKIHKNNKLTQQLRTSFIQTENKLKCTLCNFNQIIIYTLHLESIFLPKTFHLDKPPGHYAQRNALI